MAAVVINGDTSGSVTLQAPAVAGSTTITLPSTSGTLASIASVNNNGVVYANSSGQPTTSTGFVFDGANVGIGTSSPANKLQVYQNASAAVMAVQNQTTSLQIQVNDGVATGAGVIYQTGAYPLTLWTNTSERMRIDSSGNVGIGMTPTNFGNGYTVLQVANATNGGMLYLTNTSNAGGRIYGNAAGMTYDAFSTTYHAFNTNNSERMRIDSSGNLMIGQTSLTNVRCGVKGYDATSSYWSYYAIDSAGTSLFGVRNDGAIYVPKLVNFTSGSGANVYYDNNYFYKSTSSLKYKKNVQNATHGLAELLVLRSVTYEGKSEIDAGKTFGGLIAEEVHEAGLTEFVQYAEDGTPDALAYGNMVSLCIKAIQELKQIVDAQAAEIAQLKGAQQ